MMEITKKELIDFETEIMEAFLAKEIPYPIHLSNNNEDELIKIFSEIRSFDWVVSTHRNHYHALLKGIEKKWLREAILSGNSMHLINRARKFISTSIVGGGIPIALGLALASKLKAEPDITWCFVGDMAAETGGFHEAVKYASRMALPIVFVIEDNKLSVNTPTEEVWGTKYHFPDVIKYEYKRVYPHSGAGKWVNF